jgi:hypothetical protein
VLDFVKPAYKINNRGGYEIYPKFIIKSKPKDLMIRGGDFYAFWDEGRGLWSTDEGDLIDRIDMMLDDFKQQNTDKFPSNAKINYMWDSESGSIDAWHKYCQIQMRDSFIPLDENLIFLNDECTKDDYASKRLPYPLEEGSIDAYDKLISTLYTSEERHKIEWAIGAIVTGESKYIQKFLVLYGAAGTGKSTILNIIEQLFEGYYSVFDAKALGSASNAFALEAFKTNPLVAIQHDGDLSKIEDNTRLNSVVSHELMTVNEKFKPTYPGRFYAFLFMGTNKPVKITDGKSGLIRRLIDVSPSGNKLDPVEYKAITQRIPFELGHIAWHCKEVYLSNPGYYDTYTPLMMLGASNDFYNFVEDAYHSFKKEDSTTVKAAWEMYQVYCEEAKVPYPYSRRAFKEELKNYFREYKELIEDVDGQIIRNVYYGFRTEKFDSMFGEVTKKEPTKPPLIEFSYTSSAFDQDYADCPAQYASSAGTPLKAWENVTTTLKDLDTSKLHYVRGPGTHIFIDFDIPDENGNKCFEKNLEAASKWPPTYAELSKSGAGIHLHYIYTGDPSRLNRLYADHIEIKTCTGLQSIRRQLSKCNNLPIATISSGLPLKGEEKLVDIDSIQDEKHLRAMIRKNLRKEVHGSTKCSIDFINKLLTDTYNSGVKYDVSDLHDSVLAFAMSSTNQAEYCMKLVCNMPFKSDEPSDNRDSSDAEIVFYDIEVFPNLFLVNWKFQGEGKPVVRMINPSVFDIQKLISYRLIGFNNRKYDNHILYARLIGYTNEQLYNLSQSIINENTGTFGEAYNLSYTDVYDFSSKKQSLKKWEIDLGIHHEELGLPWDEPVPEELWDKVAEYCDNDVIATEAVFNHCQGDWVARQILAELAGMTVNDTTNSLTTRIIFGRERKPKLTYTDLATGEQFGEYKSPPNVLNKFPGYEFKYIEGDTRKHNIYRNTDIGFGGYIVSFPGIYGNVALLDIASLHPNSIRAMQCFGKYTRNFTDLLDARIAIKHKDFDSARGMLDGRLAKYLDDESVAKDLAQALKIAINSVYGLTAARFDNPFRDPRNFNNIVALRGALFMRTLQDEVESRGYRIVAIKTDSIKIADATKEIIDFCMDFAKQYGYTFEHEATYDRICQINDADYIARYKDPDWCMTNYGYVPGDNAKHGGEWTVTGARFAVPYVYKNLFSKEPITFEDMCEAKSVKTAMYLDMNEDIPEGESNLRFVGKVGAFCPIKPGCGGGLLVRKAKTNDGRDKYDSVVGTKDYRWLESEVVSRLGREDDIDRSYYNRLVDEAVELISTYGDFEWFASDDPYIGPEFAPGDDMSYPVYLN